MQKTNFRFEAIVHDDASTDETAAIIREYAEKYPDIIKPIFETENQYSKHDGSIGRIIDEYTHGKYVAMCEGDDYWIDPLKLQKQVDFLEIHNEYGLVYTDVDKYYQRKGVFSKAIFHNKIQPVYFTFEEHLINAGFFAPCTWLIRREKMIVDLFSSVDGTYEMLLHILKSSKIYFLDEVTTVYRVLENSASHSTSYAARYKRAKGIYDIQRKFINEYSVDEKTVSLVVRKYYERYFLYMVINKDLKEINEAKKIFDRNSFSTINKIIWLLSRIPMGRAALRLMLVLRKIMKR
ncbi:glycosyltransferase [Bacteroides sp.]